MNIEGQTLANTAISPECAPLLEIEDLHVSVPAQNGRKFVISGLTLSVNAGEVVALVGESGSGKSMTALSLMRLLPHGAEINSGRISFAGRDILALSSSELDALRGADISMLFQQPQAMLDPTSRVRTQVAEPLWIHRKMSRHAALNRVVGLLSDVGIPHPSARAQCFAHELSGGMAQRVMIAAALSGNPQLLIADEPTTALDVTVQAQILRLLDDERRKRRLATLLITHDLSVVAAFADRIAVMYAGRIVEEGPTQAILKAPQHPYTKALISCSLLTTDSEGQLLTIPGSSAQAHDMSCGCRFHPRCALANSAGMSGRCMASEPDLNALPEGRKARCWAVGHDHANHDYTGHDHTGHTVC
ncbi:ABC transporter ATP-binding protein [Agrobacterium sp. CR_3]|uniref:ABC transporter ATP-binding protein n=1 Tax=Agrobacterium sp. CR_3 TaxID=3055791 RepID=UPI0035C0F4F7